MPHVDSLESILLLSALVLIAAIIAVRIGARLGLPALLLFLGLGVLMGDSVLGLQFNDAQLAQAIGLTALVIILAEGGLTTRWRDIKPSMGVATVLATVGVVVSIGLMTLFGRFVLGLSIWHAMLLGAVTSPTDAAAVFSVLRSVPLPHRISGILEAESGLNDAPTVLLVTTASTLALAAAGQDTHGHATNPWVVVGLIVIELVGGVLLGGLLGWIGAFIQRRVALPASGLYPLATLAWVFLAYGLGTIIHVSGFAAVFVTALILGNSQLPHRQATRSFVEGIGWISQIGLFVMLGLLASPGRLSWREVVAGVAAGLVLTFVARPVSVLLSSLPFRIPWRDQAFVSWAGLRGAVPIVLTTIPMAAGVPNADYLFDVVFIFVIVFTLLQAPTLPLLARLLRLTDPSAVTDLEIEAAPLDKIGAEMLQIKIPGGSKLAGVSLQELRLPRNTVVSLVIRDAKPFTPDERERLRTGDELLIVAPSQLRQQAEDRMQAISQHGRLAHWASESGTRGLRARLPARLRRGAGAVRRDDAARAQTGRADAGVPGAAPSDPASTQAPRSAVIGRLRPPPRREPAARRPDQPVGSDQVPESRSVTEAGSLAPDVAGEVVPPDPS